MQYLKIKKEFLLGFFTGIIVIIGILSFSIGFETVARAVTFDSDIVPVVSSSIRVGIAPGQIQSINNVLFFDGQTIGIGAMPTNTSTVRLNIASGGLRFSNVTAPPTCDSSRRGTMWFSAATSTGYKDSLAVCYRNYDGSYAWATFRGK